MAPFQKKVEKRPRKFVKLYLVGTETLKANNAPRDSASQRRQSV